MKYIHFRNATNVLVATIAYEEQGDLVYYGCSVVSLKDQFCYKTGRKIAVERLVYLNSQVDLTVAKSQSPFYYEFKKYRGKTDVLPSNVRSLSVSFGRCGVTATANFKKQVKFLRSELRSYFDVPGRN